MTVFVRHELDEQHVLYEGVLPPELLPGPVEFDNLWALHPETSPEIHLHGRRVRVPRWQQAYGAPYRFSGATYGALAIPEELTALHGWVKTTIDARLNGLLLNWYDADLKHYIGKHRDSIIGMVTGAPIVTVSLGEERVFRLRPWKGPGMRDFPAVNGTVFVMPFATNQAWTHEVPHSARSRDRRISVTFRAFHRESTSFRAR